jgi:hypothetical protein
MKVNVIYDNSGIRTPTGATANLPLAGLADVRVLTYSVARTPPAAPVGNRLAASVIQSNGELIGNAVVPSNPLPPGITS